RRKDYSRSKSRTGFSAGPSRAFLSPSSNLRARTSSFLFSASHDSRNLSSRRRACSARILAASEISTSGAAFGGAVCDKTVASSTSTTSFDWQHGQTTSMDADFLDMAPLYAFGGSLHQRSRDP